MDENEAIFTKENPKKGTKLLSILDKLRNSVPDTHSSPSTTHECEDEEKAEDESRDENLKNTKDVDIVGVDLVERSSLTKPEMPKQASDALNQASHGTPDNAPAIDDTSPSRGQSFLRVSSQICDYDADVQMESTAADTSAVEDDAIVTIVPVDDAELSEALRRSGKSPDYLSESPLGAAVPTSDENIAFSRSPLDEAEQMTNDGPAASDTIECSNEVPIASGNIDSNETVTVLPSADDDRVVNDLQLTNAEKDTQGYDAEMFDVDRVTVVPLDDDGHLEIDGLVGEEREKLVSVWAPEKGEILAEEAIERFGSSSRIPAEDDIPSHVNCTACGMKIRTASQKVLQHPVLAVLICKGCNKFYNSSSFRRDKYGMEEFCKWCGDGGDLICCDFCEKVYCQKCVKRNMGRNFLKILLEAEEEKWKCFVCDPSQIDSYKEDCVVVMKVLKRMKMKGFAFERNKTHLGGPSQLERKERLKIISHTLEDEAAEPNKIVKLEIDPDLDVPAYENLIDNKNNQELHETGGDSSKKEKEKSAVDDIGNKHSTRDDTVSVIRASDMEMDLSAEEAPFPLKELKVELVRMAIPDNCIMPMQLSTDAAESSSDQPPGEFFECEGIVENKAGSNSSVAGTETEKMIFSLISDSEDDSVNMASSCDSGASEGAYRKLNDASVTKKSEKVNKSVRNSDDASGSDSDAQAEKDDSDRNEDDVINEVHNDDSFDKIKEESDETEMGNEVALSSKDSSESDFDYQRLIKRSTKRHVRTSEKEAGSSSDNTDISCNINESKGVSSSDSAPQQRGGKRKRKNSQRRKRDSSSNSDSDVLARTKKRPRRKRKMLSASASDIGSDEDEGRSKRKTGGKRGKGTTSKGKKQGKGRKGKGKLASSDSNESSDDDKSPSKNKGRKNIRRILADEELTEETRKARQLEEERRRRLLERTQATYVEEQARKKHDMAGNLVLEIDKKTGHALVDVHESLASNLKPHQAEGIQFMYDCLFESVEKFKNGDKGSGALLAHCMGLGKSLQIIALLHAIVNNPLLGLSKFLIVAPLNTVYNWENEFEKWLELDQRMDVHVLTDSGSNLKLRMSMLKEWHSNGGVMILGYEMYRNMTQFKRIKNKKHKKIITETLVDPGPDLVVCDEGHILRNDLSAISQALTKIKTLRRVVLTGTPLQNNLSEYFVMVSFVKPSLLGTKKEFTNLFMNPIQNGQCANSTPADVKVMKQRCHVLHDTLSGCVQRKDYSVLTPFLTPKHEYTIFVRLGGRQLKMYQYYLDTFVYGNLSEVRARGSSIFADYQCLMKIWTHPWAVKLEAMRRLERENLENMREFLNDSEPDSESSTGAVHEDKWRSSDSESEARRTSSSSDSSQASENEEEQNAKVVADASKQGSSRSKEPRTLRSNRVAEPMGKNSKTITLKNGKARLTLDREIFDADDSEEEGQSSGEKADVDDIVVVKPEEESVQKMGSTRSGTVFKEHEEIIEEKEWYDEFIEDGDDTNVELSGKLVLMLEIVANAEIVGDKVLIFSQSLSSLDLIERTLGGGRIDGNEISWCKGVDYFRLDGSTPAKTRQRYSDIFNDVENQTARLFLISTKAGSLGVNLVAANRVIVFDCSWNPSHDVQSVFRVYRFGQDKPVYVYRFISQGTMEQKIYERQINKLALAGRVVDEQQISRHFTDEEIKELYAFTAEEFVEGDVTPVPQLPADPLLAEVLQRQHPKWIVKYHEHDILLENVEDEQLTEEERRQAWANYEEQKDYAARTIAREAERARLYQERLLALQQQEQQQIAESHRLQQQQQQQQQQQRNDIDSRIHQHQEVLRRFNTSLQNTAHPPGYRTVKFDPGQRPMPALSAEERFRDHQMMNFAGLRAPIQRFPPWMQSNTRPNLPVHMQNMVQIVNQQRPRASQETVIRPTYPHIQQTRSAVNLQTDPGIRIVNVGSLQRNASFSTLPRRYMPPRS